MSRTPHNKPGQNIREWAAKERNAAYKLYAQAGLIVVSTPFIIEFLGFLIKQVLHLPSFIYVALIILALASAIRKVWDLIREGNKKRDGVKLKDQGAEGEETIAGLISYLERRGWRLEYGPKIGQGDIDIVCTSPKNQVYIVDVKSHSGAVFKDGERVEKRPYPFKEGDLLRKVKWQAMRIRELRGYKFVQPILAFSRAKVEVPEGKVNGVYVVDRYQLGPLLERLG